MPRRTPILFAGLLALSVAVSACDLVTTGAPDATQPPAALSTLPPVESATGPETTTTTLPPTTTTTLAPGGVGAPHGTVNGLTMFRGNPTRTWYGAGPIPRDMQVLWRFPDAAMCGNSPVGGENITWCGSGWTGQPVVWEREDGVTEVIFGAYDKAIHFVDADTGERTRPDFDMGDIIKGSVTLDPDGFPLLYSGSRDPRFKIIALDRDEPVELWGLAADGVPGMWNNDWDSNPVVVDDILYQGGENSWWYAIKLNRDYDADGNVTVDPEIVFDMPAFTDELVAAVGRQQSVESSTAVFEGRAYFSNSAGRIVGVDVSDLPDGDASVVLDYWVGDDVDATIVVDGAGDLYVAAEMDLQTSRAAEVGQLVKLDPDNPDDPVVWGVEVPARGGVPGGLWATPALHGDVIYAATNPGELLAVDTGSGDVLWRDEIGAHAWSSPVVADDRLLVAVNCETVPALRVYDIADAANPTLLTEAPVSAGCIESTPAVWKGRVFVGSRDGFFYAVGER